VFRVAREDDDAGELFERGGAIERVGNEILAGGEDVLGANETLEFGNYVRCERHVVASMFYQLALVKETGHGEV
jgi:hypothetical protein